MAPSCAAPRYVSNKSLGIKRPPTAFSLYLKAMAGQAHRYVGSRIVGKTTVFRMDLLRQKFDGLGDDDRQHYVAAAEAARRQSKALRQSALQHKGGTSSGSDGTALSSGPGVAKPPEPDALGESAVAGREADPSGDTIDWIDPVSGARRCLAVLGVLGRGVFGVCKKVIDVETREAFCAKFPSDDPTAVTALRDECMFMKRCDHPNISRLISTIAEGKTLKAALMPLMLGNLWHFIVDRADLPTDLCLFAHWERSALIQITAGLVHLHSRSIFHLDVKPDNVLVQEQPHSPGYCFRISDLGNAHTLLDLFGQPCSELCDAQCINSAPYRPFYLFQVRGTVKVTSRFDIWALGCLMFDIGQTSPRSRDAAGYLDRLMSDTCSDGVSDHAQSSMWRRFDDRLRVHARRDAQCLIRRMCPRSRTLADQVGLQALDAALRALKTSTLPSAGEEQNNRQRV